VVRGLSFSYDLHQISRAVFQGGEILTRAATMIPLLNADVTRNLKEAGAVLGADNLGGALIGLAILVALASLVFARRLKPE
jgi:hypothetical protein